MHSKLLGDSLGILVGGMTDLVQPPLLELDNTDEDQAEKAVGAAAYDVVEVTKPQPRPLALEVVIANILE